jgi:hypothetical protein
MTHFRCLPIPMEDAARFRATGIDDGGNPIRLMDEPDAPCRVCLRNARAGEPVLLGSWHLKRPRGIYWTPSPIFVHARTCAPFGMPDTVPDIVRGRMVSVRAYGGEGDMCLYDLGHAGDGDGIEAPLARALDDRRTSFVNIHTARPGCLLCRVERA